MFLELKAKIDAIKSIKNNIEMIEEIYDIADKNNLSESDYGLLVNYVKNKIQNEALNAWIENGHRGIILMATGCGKSRIPIMYMQSNSNLKYPILIVPTEKLRDKNWLEEFQKTENELEYEKLQRSCYASISKIENKFYDFCILDEAHNLTKNNSSFLENNINAKIMLLTATLPSNSDKIEVLENFGFKVVYEITLNEAVRLKMISPYEIILVETNLNNTTKNIKSGNSKKQFKVTEKEFYDYLNTKISKLEPRAVLSKPVYTESSYGYSDDAVRKNRGLSEKEQVTLNNLILKRLNFIYNLESKLLHAKMIVKYLQEKKKRTLVFCGSINVANNLCEHRYHSKTNSDSLDLFMKNEIQMLSCVNSLNEGVNIPSVEVGLIVQLNNNEKDLIQRIGRIIRYKSNHKGKIIILYCKETEDEKWMKNVIEKLNVKEISKISTSDLLLNIKEI